MLCRPYISQCIDLNSLLPNDAIWHHDLCELRSRNKLRVCTFSHVCWVESFQERVGLSPFAADHDVVPGLVPEVVAEGRGISLPLPVAHDIERLAIQNNEATYANIQECIRNRRGESVQLHVQRAHSRQYASLVPKVGL